MRKREGNKEHDILQAAVKVFAKEGYHQAKISKIAEEAGVATGSIYLYFQNKEAIILSLFERLWSQLLTELRQTSERTDLTPTQKLDCTIDHLFGMFIRNPLLATVFANEQTHLIQKRKGNSWKQYEDFLDLAELIVRQGIPTNDFNSEVNIGMFRIFITGGLRNLLRTWAQHPKSIDLEAMRSNVKLFIRKGIAA